MFLNLGMDRDYKNRENEDKIIEILKKIIKPKNAEENVSLENLMI